jgi:hypothetical protein
MIATCRLYPSVAYGCFHSSTGKTISFYKMGFTRVKSAHISAPKTALARLLNQNKVSN